MDQIIVSGQKLGKKYGKNWIFRDLDISIKKTDFVCITGRNGAGKSTLLQILSGYLSPSEGHILHDDQKIDEESPLEISFSSPYIELP